ncbi:hypothetical protein L4C36_17140 [Photobacterium japonica]|uniref:hypothetical protein n=1 Tax=Photobacterium japonica TaxID=2910235 RepID=UPI003D135B4B
MNNNDLICIVRRALIEWNTAGMSNDEFANIIDLKDETLDGVPHKKWRLNGHLEYAVKHKGKYRDGSLKHRQHLKIATHYLLN